MKILADPNITAVEVFANFGELVLKEGRSWTPQDVKGIHALLIRSVTKITEQLLENCPVNFIGTATSGIDHVDLVAIQRRGIQFVTAQGSNAQSVAEYILSGILVWLADQRKYPRDITVAIVGYGHVGKAVYRLLSALGITCLVNDPPLQDGGYPHDFYELGDVLNADVVTLHVPLICDGRHPTFRLINVDNIHLLNPNGLLINASRGDVVDESALLQFLLQHQDAKAIIDCWCHEPAIEHSLLNLSYLATPHIAGYSYDGKLQATKMLYQSLRRHIGMTEQSCLNFDDDVEEVFSISDCQDPLTEISRFVWNCYDIRTDSAALKNTLKLPVDKRASCFDKLRRMYRKRREFSHYRIAIKSNNAELINQLRRLNFQINEVN